MSSCHGQCYSDGPEGIHITFIEDAKTPQQPDVQEAAVEACWQLSGRKVLKVLSGHISHNDMKVQFSLTSLSMS
ncbi:uncharacterized protein N7483_011213 [Penicillium malachiteum]|uniref:uncharacterized protein n=1 Tax=Penicillium malachiteum TaxID=1324776 RepID=UPI00254909DD|nr:uncharacterized protein N7483_011213 [Penicillium malachiteum]KAJ5714032.1 hypothetical protein N7483_011213 [Penicillium malachiteum]